MLTPDLAGVFTRINCGRTFTAYSKYRWTVVRIPQTLRTTTPPAVVAASQQPSVLHSEDHLLAVQDSKLGSPGQRFRILSGLAAAELNGPPTRCWWSGCAGGSGVVLELLQLASATRPTASMMSTPTRNLQVCRHPCTSALRENARLPHTAVPWQVLGSLKTVFHESIPSIY